MKLLSSVLLCVLLLSSCSWFNEHVLPQGEYAPAYLQEDSPLDPPGTAAAREAARKKLLKEGTFRRGDTPAVLQGKAFLFNRNPDTTKEPSGKMVKTEKAKIIACEGLYYFVQVDDGSRGFLRESDLEPPVQLVTTSEIVEPMEPVAPAADSIFPPEAPLPLEGNQKLMTNQDGRTVIIVGKKSDRSQEFEARKKALEQGHQQNAASKGSPEASAPLPDPADVPLPEPAGGGDS